jgi:hypothetical protein
MSNTATTGLAGQGDQRAALRSGDGSNEPAFGVCSDLIVRTDHGHSEGDYKNISLCECRAQREGCPCRRKGVCIEARQAETWTRINSACWSKVERGVMVLDEPRG